MRYSKCPPSARTHDIHAKSTQDLGFPRYHFQVHARSWISTISFPSPRKIWDFHDTISKSTQDLGFLKNHTRVYRILAGTCVVFQVLLFLQMLQLHPNITQKDKVLVPLPWRGIAHWALKRKLIHFTEAYMIMIFLKKNGIPEQDVLN